MEETADGNSYAATLRDTYSQRKSLEVLEAHRVIGAMIKDQARGMDSNFAKTFATGMKDGINSVDFTISQSKETDLSVLANIVACNIAEGIQACIRKGGAILPRIFEWNFDLDLFQKEYEDEFRAMNAQVEEIEIEVDTIASAKPTATAELSLAEMEKKEKEIEAAEAEFLSQFDERIEIITQRVSQ